MAKKIVAGNWKMNLSLNEALQLGHDLKTKLDDNDVRVILFPPSLYIHALSVTGSDHIELGAQNFSEHESGAFTGEISIGQLKSVGGTIGLIGHSERRAYYKEDDELLKAKVNAAIEQDLDFVFCCGEPLMIRESGQELNFVKQQLESSLFHLSAESIMGGIIAYEPVWAIGTGKTASSDQAEEMHANIRTWLIEKYNDEVANSVSILYGGSCNAANAKELFSCPNVDGGLIGGASLKAVDFISIIDSY